MSIEDFFFSKIKRGSTVLCFGEIDEKIIKDLDLILHTNPSETDKYDIIIFQGVFPTEENVAEKYKNYLKDCGKIIFINEVITDYMYYKYHPYNCLTFGYLRYYEYLENIYDKLKENELKIIDSYRIDSSNILGILESPI